jgi:hypothetical protein
MRLCAILQELHLMMTAMVLALVQSLEQEVQSLEVRLATIVKVSTTNTSTLLSLPLKSAFVAVLSHTQQHKHIV